MSDMSGETDISGCGIIIAERGKTDILDNRGGTAVSGIPDNPVKPTQTVTSQLKSDNPGEPGIPLMSSITGMSAITDIGDIMDIDDIRDKVADLMTRLDIVAETSTNYQELYQIRTLLAEAAELTN